MAEHSQSYLHHLHTFIRAFIVKPRQRRWLELSGVNKGFSKLRLNLAHCERDLDMAVLARIAAGLHNANDIVALLLKNGALPECALISESGTLDGQTMAILPAVERVVGHGFTTIISCIPGQLVFVETEAGERLIGVRRKKA
jgi:hypothetical protein